MTFVRALPAPAPALRVPSARALIAFGLVLHLALAFTGGLSPDEAHYALYGAHVDWSYFDHPPLVGWLQAPFVAAGGGDVLMRIVPMACWWLAAALAVALGRALPLAQPQPPDAGDRRDAWAVGLLLLAPLLNLPGVALVPDSLLLPLILSGMLATWRLRDPLHAADLRRWGALGLVLALSILSKYTGVFVVLGALLCLARYHGRALAGMRGFWLAAAMALAGALPVVGWNVAHHWASIAYQAHHAAGDTTWHARAFARASATQLLAYGWLLPVGAVVALTDRARSPAPRAADGDLRAARHLSLAFGLPLLLTFAVLSGAGATLPHWTAGGWTALVPLAAAGCLQLPRAVARAGVLWQGLALAALLAIVAAGGVSAERGDAARAAAGVRTPGTLQNPVADLYGWEAAARRAAALARQHHVRALVVMNWSQASRLAWYARPMPVIVAPAHADQFALWFEPLADGESAIVVDWSQMPLPLPVGAGAFDRCVPLDQLATARAGRQIAHFNFLLCRDWHAAAPHAPRPGPARPRPALSKDQPHET